MVVAVSKHKIACMVVPKAACSSIKATMAALDGRLDQMSVDDDSIHDIVPTMRFRPHRWAQYHDWWRFVVVRDPLKRLLSVYTDRVLKRRDLFNSRKLKGPDAVLTREPDPDFFFQNLQGYIENASIIKHHALTSRLFIGAKPLLYDRVYRIEDMGQLADDLSERTGQDVKFPHFNTSQSARLGFGDLAPKTQDSLRRYLAEEYELLDDFYENPM